MYYDIKNKICNKYPKLKPSDIKIKISDGKKQDISICCYNLSQILNIEVNKLAKDIANIF